ncbi:DUF3267 domain-containing protein [Porcipelethomonas sp.]|uniref:DUF3267 domain-containing protein n=1 Tax=Porcipelethomonas sp. TaxID=2981675 RepID=UPI003EF17646
MENRTSLPDDYREVLKIDLQKNKKSALLVNGLAMLIAAVMVLIPLLSENTRFVIMDYLFENSFFKLITLLVGIVVYFILHELVHGIFMKKFSGIKPKYGFTGLYAYAGSTAYFNKKSYICIALAPIVVWGIVLVVLQFAVPSSWSFIAYVIQIINISGAAGDIYVTYKMSRLPSDILVNDTGVSMTVYSSEI